MGGSRTAWGLRDGLSDGRTASSVGCWYSRIWRGPPRKQGQPRRVRSWTRSIGGTPRNWTQSRRGESEFVRSKDYIIFGSKMLRVHSRRRTHSSVPRRNNQTFAIALKRCPANFHRLFCPPGSEIDEGGPRRAISRRLTIRPVFTHSRFWVTKNSLHSEFSLFRSLSLSIYLSLSLSLPSLFLSPSLRVSLSPCSNYI